MQQALIPFDKLKPKSGDIVFSNCNDNGWYHHQKKEHLYTVADTIVKNCNMNNPVVSFVDFGGVSANHLQEGENYITDNPKPIKKNGLSFIFSFVPTNKKFAEIESMKASATAAGFDGIVILTKKEGDRGKADVMNALAKSIPDTTEIIYYEDTADVLDEVDNRVKRMWVQPPVGSGFENMVPKDPQVETLSVTEYLGKILA